MTVYNGSTWRITELFVPPQPARQDDNCVEDERPLTLLPVGAQVDQGVDKLLTRSLRTAASRVSIPSTPASSWARRGRGPRPSAPPSSGRRDTRRGSSPSGSLLHDDLAVARGQALEAAFVAGRDPPAERSGPSDGQLESGRGCVALHEHRVAAPGRSSTE